MKIADFRLLKKLMQMTTSDSDQESLTALRRANAIIARSDTTWERVFDRLVSLEVEPEPAVRTPGASARQETGRARYVEDLLSGAEAALEGGYATDQWREFVESLREQFDERGFLSQAQVEALERSRARRQDRRSA